MQSYSPLSMVLYRDVNGNLSFGKITLLALIGIYCVFINPMFLFGMFELFIIFYCFYAIWKITTSMLKTKEA